MGVVVLADSRADRSTLPSGYTELRSDGRAGNTIPMVFVTSSDGSKGIEAISYVKLRDDMRGAVREVKDAVESAHSLTGGTEKPGRTMESATTSAADTTPSGGPTADSSGLLVESRKWTNHEGRTIVAAIESADEAEVRFLLPDGQVVPYPLADLSPESRQRIVDLIPE